MKKKAFVVVGKKFSSMEPCKESVKVKIDKRGKGIALTMTIPQSPAPKPSQND